jgi:outer membrane protein
MNKLTYILLAVLIISAAVFSMGAYLQPPKTAYVVTQNVFSEFQLSKDFEKKLGNLKVEHARKLDSLKAIMKAQYNQDGQISETIQDGYFTTEEEQVNERNHLTQSYNEQIWKQLNQYIKEYGEINKYSYIYGATGQGGIMYARETENITEEVISYVNARYEGNI